MIKRVCACVVMVLSVSACTDDDGSTPNGPGESCTGSVLGCTWAELSARQEMEACDLISASIDDPAGTKYECMAGPNQGLYLEIESSAACVARSYKAGCPITVQQSLDCFKAAKRDVCAAFGDGGICSKLLEVGAGC
jgi:hypothetical protein